MFPQLPASPYDLAEDKGEEAYYVTKWQAVIQESPHNEDHWQEVDTVQNVFDDEAAATAAGASKLLEYPDDEDWRYRIVVEEIQVEADPPEPDWDSAPGGHDDI